MRLVKLSALILAIALCLFIAGCAGSAQTPADNSDNVVSETDSDTASSTPLLYKVTDEDGNIAWLFGSIHVGREDFYPLPDYVLDAFNGSDALAVEADIIAFERDMSAQMDALSLLVYTDGTTISDHIPEDIYISASDIMDENELYNIAMDYYMPSLWWNFIDNCAYMQLEVDVEGGIDRFLLDLAKENEKEVLEVESALFQYGMLADFSEELQIYLLEASVEAYGDLETMDADLNEMMDLWAAGNEQEFAAYLNAEEEFESEEEELLYAEYIKAMLTDRNENMADYAEDALKSGKEVFICVGAAHVVGEGAMAQKLAERGYTVEIVK